jgi:GT2 family glycosyltransferase
MSNGLVSVIIATKGKSIYFSSCLDSLKSQDYPFVEVIVIDNSLNHDFAERLASDYSKIKLYSAYPNLSFCESMNKGIAMCSGDFILLLNDDAAIDKEYIKEALRGFVLDPLIGMVSGKILRFDAKTIDSSGLFLSIWRTVKERGHGKLDRGQFDDEGYIFGVNGAVAFYRREMLEQVKVGADYFDSDFRFFYEDLDIAWRAQNFGWKGYYIPRAVAYHARGATARSREGKGKRFARRFLDDELQFDLLKNRCLAIIKNDTFCGFVLHLPFIFVYELFSWLYVFFARAKLIKNICRMPVLIKSAFKKRAVLKRMRETS